MNRLRSLSLSLLLLPLGAFGSYDATGFGDHLTGTLSSTINVPFTMGLWVKRADWPAANDVFLSFADDFADVENYAALRDPAIANTVGAVMVDTGANEAQFGFADGTYDNVWVCVVGTFVSTTNRNVYIEDSTNTAQNTTSRTVPGLDSITVGALPTSGGSPESLVAEVAIWDVTLSTTDIDAFCGGTPANQVDQSNLVGYWPLATEQGTHADQSGNGGPTLTANGGIVFSSDHPTITPAGCTVCILRLRHE